MPLRDRDSNRMLSPIQDGVANLLVPRIMRLLLFTVEYYIVSQWNGCNFYLFFCDTT